MPNVPVPKEIAQKISDRATQLARENLQKRGWKSANAIEPMAEDGMVGLKTTVKYLMYQNRGTAPRLMKELEGKTIPMKMPGGGTNFRVAKGVGQPGWVTLPGGVRKWRNQKWFHPGIKPQNFMENSIQQAIKEYQGQLNKMMLDVLMGKGV